jgi:branched-chain amino acid aminotransferase
MTEHSKNDKYDPTRWGVTSLKLQRPENVYADGAVRPWEEAVVHVSTEAVTRGLNVFEGVNGYWQESGGFGFLALRRHYERMRRSGKLLYIPVEFSYDEFAEAFFEITAAELRDGKDLHVRATLLVVAGHWGEGTVADLVLTAYQQDREPPPRITVGTSTWRRSPDLSFPARIKTGANYGIARLARLEGRSRGYDDMILLNASGRVAEATSACILLVRDGVVISPPASEGALESITLDIASELAKDEGIPFVRRPIERSELYIADELGMTGTLAEVTGIRAVDDQPLPDEAPILERLAQRYRDGLRGSRPHPAMELSLVPDYARP